MMNKAIEIPAKYVIAFFLPLPVDVVNLNIFEKEELFNYIEYPWLNNLKGCCIVLYDYWTVYFYINIPIHEWMSDWKKDKREEGGVVLWIRVTRNDRWSKVK